MTAFDPDSIKKHEYQSILDTLDPFLAISIVKAWEILPNKSEDRAERESQFRSVWTELADALWKGGPAKRADAAKAEVVDLTRFSSIATPARSFLERQIEKPASLLGDGIAAGFQVGTLIGVAGTGKSWVLLHQARAWARGDSFFGLWVPPTGLRVGVLELEDHAHTWQQRLRKLVGEEPDDKDDRVEIVTKPELKGPVDMRDANTVKALAHWVKERELGGLIVDSLKHAHMGNENDNEHMHWVMLGFQAVADETGAVVLVGHHESPKETMTGRTRSLQAAGRGASAVFDDSRFQFVLRRHPTGLRRLSVSKANHSPDVGDIWLRQIDGGPFELGQAPDSVADVNLEKVRLAISDGSGPTREQIQQSTGLKRPTVTKHLRALAATHDNSKAPRYFPAATRLPAATQGTVAGLSTNGDNELRLIER